jgi:hypothetical protein
MELHHVVAARENDMRLASRHRLDRQQPVDLHGADI